MARTYIAVPIDPAHAAEVLASTLDAHRESPEEASERGYTGPPRILRLRDCAGPSLRERLDTHRERMRAHEETTARRFNELESFARAINDGLSARLAALESAEKDAVGRAGASLREIGDRVIAMCDSRLVDMGKRLAALETALGEPVCVGCSGSVGHHHAPDQGGCSGWFPTVREHLARVETEHRAAVERIGDLEREPAAVRPEPGSVAEPAPADPDRLAKVAHRAEIDKHLARPYTGAEWDALLPQGRDRLRRIAHDVAEAYSANVSAASAADRAALAEELAALKTALPIFHNCPEGVDFAKSAHEWARARDAAMHKERDALLARIRSRDAGLEVEWRQRGEEIAKLRTEAEKTERELRKWVQEACDVGEALDPYRARPTAAFLSRAEEIRDLVGEWKKRCEELEALRGDVARAVAIAELGHGENPREMGDSEIEQAVWDLKRATPCATPAPSAPRDPLADPQPGDWFVDTDGSPDVTEVLERSGTGCSVRRHYVAGYSETYSWSIDALASDPFRPMAPAEVAAFQRDATRPTAAPSEAEMAAELDAAGWMEAVTGWADTNGDARDLSLSAAHAAMRAAKGAR